MRLVVTCLLLSALLLACAEEGPVCADPYIPNGQSCCVDRDADGACDTAAPSEQAAASCDLCPPKFVTQKEEVIVYRYVCMNGSVMEAASQCEQRIISNAHLFRPNREQDDALIDDFEARPACRGEYTAAEIHLALTKPPQRVVFQVQEEPAGGFRDLGALEGTKTILDDEYFYIGFCERLDCSTVTDAQLPATGAYLVRAMLQYQDGQRYTRDLLLDPTPDGEYGKKRC